MQVTYDDEQGPEGFERVSRDLAKGGASGRRAYLWLRRQSFATGTAAAAAVATAAGADSSSSMEKPAPTLEVTAAAAGSVPERTDNESDTTSDPAPSEPVLPLLPLGEVVIGFGASDPNVAEAAERGAEVATTAAGGKKERARASEDDGKMRRLWERLDRSLNPGAGGRAGGEAGAVFLWYRRGSEDESQPWSSRSLAVSECRLGKARRGGREGFRVER